MKKFLSIFLILIFSFVLISCENNTSNEWTPEGIWLGYPIHDRDPHPEEIDIELSFTTEEPDFANKPTSIQIVNKKGNSFDFCPIVYLEKCDAINYDIHPYYSGFWVSVPYDPREAWFSLNSEDDTASVCFYPNFLCEGYKITPGYYRFVVFVENEPHYIKFEIE